MFTPDRIVIVNKLLDRLLKIQVFQLILPMHYRFVPYDIYLEQPINPSPPPPHTHTSRLSFKETIYLSYQAVKDCF